MMPLQTYLKKTYNLINMKIFKLESKRNLLTLAEHEVLAELLRDKAKIVNIARIERIAL